VSERSRRQQYRRLVYNETPLYESWSGWRLAGQRLVSPSKDWIAHISSIELYRLGRFLR
jgi:hypothetical protein